MLEGRVAELSQVFEGIQAQLTGFEERVDRRFDTFERRFEDVNRRIDSLDGKASRLFMWAVGIQVMLFTATIGAILAK